VYNMWTVEDAGDGKFPGVAVQGESRCKQKDSVVPEVVNDDDGAPRDHSLPGFVCRAADAIPYD
jgi:hypothetical protein